MTAPRRRNADDNAAWDENAGIGQSKHRIGQQRLSAIVVARNDNYEYYLKYSIYFHAEVFKQKGVSVNADFRVAQVVFILWGTGLIVTAAMMAWASQSASIEPVLIAIGGCGWLVAAMTPLMFARFISKPPFGSKKANRHLRLVKPPN
jgi:hypothetical protein